jgi:hypothetical protein
MCFSANNRPTNGNTSHFPEIISKFLKIILFVTFYKIFEPGVGLQMFERENEHLFSLQMFALNEERVWSSETVVFTYQSPWCLNTEFQNMDLHRHQNQNLT